MADGNNTCKTCRYWLDQSIIGLCRRNPKNEHKHQHEWCGEFAVNHKFTSEVSGYLPPDVVVSVVPEPRQKRKYTRRQDVKAAA